MSKTPEASLTKKKLAQYGSILENKAEEVRGSMAAQRIAALVARPDYPGDEGDLSQHSHEEWIFLNRNTLDTKLLREITSALHRIDTGHFGVCLSCEEPISPKRLEAVPWARYCVPCQERIASLPMDEQVELEQDNLVEQA